ncbi:hypothetical protein [Mariniflexile sp. AS56]|uniref:hypothetical protein n=1 Tax=Flavobacteriaceae TaxID=49546 RepID=UPI0026F220F2|nr:hypothetical protein [Mariniflexile sp. AS56]MDO7174192.1 hypothetical protein [Mariniflexile sp. AS56]
MKNGDLEVLCCFCGQDSTLSKAIEITIECNKKTKDVQAVYAHSKCLDNVLHKSVPRAFDL